MWTKGYRSQFLLIRIKKAGKAGIVIPVPLAVLSITLNAVVDLVWLGEKLFPFWHVNLDRKIRSKMRCKMGRYNWFAHISRELPPSELLKTCFSLIGNLRDQGRLRLVEVESGKNQVYIDLY